MRLTSATSIETSNSKFQVKRRPRNLSHVPHVRLLGPDNRHGRPARTIPNMTPNHDVCSKSEARIAFADRR